MRSPTSDTLHRAFGSVDAVLLYRICFAVCAGDGPLPTDFVNYRVWLHDLTVYYSDFPMTNA